MPEGRLQRTRESYPRHEYIIGCRCEDWLTCSHPWPVRFESSRNPAPIPVSLLRPYLGWPTREEMRLGQTGETIETHGWRAPHENAAEQLKRRQREGVAAFGDRANASMFRLGIDTCPTCGTTGKYDCPDCGFPHFAQRTGEDTI